MNNEFIFESNTPQNNALAIKNSFKLNDNENDSPAI